MTGILILLGMNVILWKILVKVMFAEKLAGQGKKINSPCRAWQPCSVTVSGFYSQKQGSQRRFFKTFNRWISAFYRPGWVCKPGQSARTGSSSVSKWLIYRDPLFSHWVGTLSLGNKKIWTTFFAEFWVQLDRIHRVTSRNDVFNVLQQYFCGSIHQK